MEVTPEDVVRQCLLRMPYASHNKLKAVCNSWEAILSSPTFYPDRKKCGTSQQLICLIQRDIGNHRDMNGLFVVKVYDPVKGTWDTLPPFDDLQKRSWIHDLPGIWCECVAVNRKLVVMGGKLLPNRILTKSVYIYDFESTRWRRGADMPTPRSWFACSVSSSNGLVYVAGGIGDRGIRVAGAEAYNVEEDKWEILPPMIEPRGWPCRGAFVEGKFMVLQEGKNAQVFDPSEGTWRMTNFRRSCVISSSLGELYSFTTRQVEKYDAEKDVWSVVASVPNTHGIGCIGCFICATQWRDQIFISGSCHPLCSNPQFSYLFNMSTRQFIEVNGDGGEGMIVSAATVEI